MFRSGYGDGGGGPPNDSDSEQLEAVIWLAQKKSSEAFHALYEYYYPQICKYLIRMIASYEDRHDLAQETFCKLWKVIQAGNLRAKTEPELRAWLYQAATTTAFDFLRKQRGRATDSLSNLADDPPIIDRGDVEERDCINQALAELSDLERTCLLLSVVGGFKHRQIVTIIAKSLGVHVSPARVCQIIGQAKEKFRQAYPCLPA
jgi:RNA polymerase sigma factor (sigma-70 family)